MGSGFVRVKLNGKPMEIKNGGIFFIEQKCPDEAGFPVEVSFEAARGILLRPPVQFRGAGVAHLFLLDGELFKLRGDGGRGIARQRDAGGIRAVKGATIVAEEAKPTRPFGKIQPRFPDELPLLFPEMGLVKIFRGGAVEQSDHRDIGHASCGLGGNDQENLEQGMEKAPAQERAEQRAHGDNGCKKQRQADEDKENGGLWVAPMDATSVEGDPCQDPCGNPSDGGPPGGVEEDVEEFFHGSRGGGRTPGYLDRLLGWRNIIGQIACFRGCWIGEARGST